MVGWGAGVAQDGAVACGLLGGVWSPSCSPASPQPTRPVRPPRLFFSCSVVVEGKNANAAFVPFRLVNYLGPAPASLAAAVAEVAELICQEEKYEAGECSTVTR